MYPHTCESSVLIQIVPTAPPLRLRPGRSIASFFATVFRIVIYDYGGARRNGNYPASTMGILLVRN